MAFSKYKMLVQKSGEFLDVKPGMRVVDACAGAGGKTLHLAALMENKRANHRHGYSWLEKN